MAKKKTAKKSGPNKSQAIRDQLQKTPKASASEIAAAVSEQVGAKVSPALVYQVKSSNGAVKKKVGRKKTAKRSPVRIATASGSVSTDLIKEAAALLSHAGDPKTAREALDAATEISKVLRQ